MPSTGETLRHDWTLSELRTLHDAPFPELLFRAQGVHRQHHDPRAIQLCTLLSIKTGGCPEDCGYCPQSAHHEAGVERTELMELDSVLSAAAAARDAGSSRFCMGAAWRSPKSERDLTRVLEMVRGVRELGLEACATLGMLTEDQAKRLAEAGLTTYNHNLDTGPDHYGSIIGTRTYADRLATLRAVRDAGIKICSGGIIGMGERIEDRLAMLGVLASLAPHPESVPINALVRAPGTPLADRPPIDPLELVRMIATARIVLPLSRIRLSAGRTELSREAQALCFLAGASSIFVGDRLLTTGNPERTADERLLADLGMTPERA
ncbi:MAG: biotin synthase BioB [Deltaproteobacteria bacterium]|nr:biotin synthase BioB [Deltaproteobacteria bacterium]